MATVYVMLPADKQAKKHLGKEIHARMSKVRFNFQVCTSWRPAVPASSLSYGEWRGGGGGGKQFIN